MVALVYNLRGVMVRLEEVMLASATRSSTLLKAVP